MKRVATVAALAVLLLSGCVPARGAVVVQTPAVAVRHVHGPGCGHFWGYYAGYPVYIEGRHYTYWDGSAWIVLRTPPPVVHHHHHRPRVHHHRTPSVRSHAAPPRSVRPHTMPHRAPPPRAHRATPAR
jgi:hypothetical protein